MTSQAGYALMAAVVVGSTGLGHCVSDEELHECGCHTAAFSVVAELR